MHFLLSFTIFGHVFALSLEGSRRCRKHFDGKDRTHQYQFKMVLEHTMNFLTFFDGPTDQTVERLTVLLVVLLPASKSMHWSLFEHVRFNRIEGH